MMVKPGNACTDFTSPLHRHVQGIRSGTYSTNESVLNNVKATTNKCHARTMQKMH